MWYVYCLSICLVICFEYCVFRETCSVDHLDLDGDICLFSRMAIWKPGVQNEWHGPRHICIGVCLHPGGHRSGQVSGTNPFYFVNIYGFFAVMVSVAMCVSEKGDKQPRREYTKCYHDILPDYVQSDYALIHNTYTSTKYISSFIHLWGP